MENVKYLDFSEKCEGFGIEVKNVKDWECGEKLDWWDLCFPKIALSVSGGSRDVG